MNDSHTPRSSISTGNGRARTSPSGGDHTVAEIALADLDAYTAPTSLDAFMFNGPSALRVVFGEPRN
jgi:hypothetical protein